MKNQLFISFLLIFFFIGLSVVSAADNATILYEDKSIENDAILIENDLLGVVEDNVIETASNDDILANEITVKDGDSIQSAIDKAEAGSTIFVSKGSYYEDLVVSKELSRFFQQQTTQSFQDFTLLSQISTGQEFILMPVAVK